MIPGDEWAYRLRDAAPSERVRVQEVRAHKHSPRVEIEFLDGGRIGEVAVVPATRLRVPWADVTAYDRLMADWERLSLYELTDTESDAATQALGLLVPQETCEWTWKPVRNGCKIYSPSDLAEIVQVDVTALLTGVATFTHEGALWTSPEGTVRIAQAAAAANPIPVLAWVHEDERKCREHTKHGRPSTIGNKGDHTTSPEWEFEYYLERSRPVHELLRQWCGHRAVTFHERLVAAEREVHRLDELLARTLDALRDGSAAAMADALGEEHEGDRITPYNVRPLVERPLLRSGVPVQVVYRQGWW